MQFKGHLQLPDEPGPGLRVNLDVAEHHLAVESDGGGLGAWPLEVVDVERLQGDIFALTVADEPLRFVADDSISFAYSAMPTIERVTRRATTRSAFRSLLDRIFSEPDPPAPSADLPPADAQPSGSTLIEDGEPSAAEAVWTTPVVEDEVSPVVEPDDMVEAREAKLVSPPTEVSGSWPDVADLADSVGCPAYRSDGRRCESPILTSSGYCYPHDPKRAFEDKYKAAHEARGQLKRDATERLNRVYSRLDKAMRQVERGDLDPETAMAMAQIARTMCAILEMDDLAGGNR